MFRPASRDDVEGVRALEHGGVDCGSHVGRVLRGRHGAIAVGPVILGADQGRAINDQNILI